MGALALRGLLPYGADVRIRSVAVTSGFLEACSLDFADQLTCVIGARGTCKSTTVELLRFAFGVGPERIATMLESSSPGVPSSSHRGLLQAALAGGTVRCRITLNDGGDAVVERAMDGSPRVLRDGVEISDFDPTATGIEVYSQGELQQVVEDPSRRLALIDRSHRSTLDRHLLDRREAVAELRSIGPRLRQMRSEIDNLGQRLRLLPKHREDLLKLSSGRAAVPHEIEAERERSAARRQRRELIDELERHRVEVAAALRDVAARRTSVDALTSRLSAEADLRPFLDAMKPLTTALGAAASATASLLEIDAAASLSAVFGADAAIDEKYRALREQQRELTESLRAEDTLRQEIEVLTAVETKRNELRAKRDALLARRAELRELLEAIADRIYELRVRQIAAINLEFEGLVLLTLQQGGSSRVHRVAIENLLEGSRLRNQADVARELSEHVPASDLVDIVEAGDAQRLASLLDRDAAQMTRLIGHVIDKVDLYELEGTGLDDWLEITLYVDDVAKPLSQLSKGQMATALLPLILREGAGPVIFDQPEDDLDNAFIFRMLVPRIRALKQRRQLIFVTHNANIPVLGDAERVVVMSMESATRASGPMAGSVDDMRVHILQLLEGGPDAFRRRGDRYAGLLPESAE
jgi:hypothetical protein